MLLRSHARSAKFAGGEFRHCRAHAEVRDQLHCVNGVVADGFLHTDTVSTTTVPAMKAPATYVLRLETDAQPAADAPLAERRQATGAVMTSSASVAEDRQDCLSMREPDRQDCLSSTGVCVDSEGPSLWLAGRSFAVYAAQEDTRACPPETRDRSAVWRRYSISARTPRGARRRR
jgi:hypothetical protein